MNRRLLITAGVVLAALVPAWVLGAPVMPSYLAVWLVLLAVPAGALPLVMGCELAGYGGSVDSGFVRWLLVAMPVAAVAGLPILLAPAGLYHTAVAGGGWFSAGWFAVRGALVLAAWTGLALACMRPPMDRPRVALCFGGLAVHAVLGTLAATDWVMSLSPGLNSAVFGLLFMAAQCGIALSVAILLCRVPPRGAAVLLGVAAAVWALLHLIQFLVVWSANKPGEVIWYLQRGSAVGVGAMWFAALCVGAALVMVLAPVWRRLGLVAAAWLLLLMHVIEMFWLVTPSVRGTFDVSLSDAGGLLCLALMCGVFVRVWQPVRVAA